MHEQLRLRRVGANGVAQLLRKGPVGREVVALDAGLLDGHEIPALRAQQLRQAQARGVKAGLVRRIALMRLHLGDVQFQRCAAHRSGAMDQVAPAGPGKIREMLRGIAREAVAHREQADGLWLARLRRGDVGREGRVEACEQTENDDAMG